MELDRSLRDLQFFIGRFDVRSALSSADVIKGKKKKIAECHISLEMHHNSEPITFSSKQPVCYSFFNMPLELI